ncbi:TPA: fimbria/pilus outer membrane usher protein [Escherichia coli]
MQKSIKYITKYSKIYLICMLCMYGKYVIAKNNYEFDTSHLNSSDGEVKIDLFNQEQFPAGDYIVDIHLNGIYKATQSVEFIKSKEKEGNITPCLDDKLLLSLGVKEKVLKKESACNNGIQKRWKITHNVYEQSLNIDIPDSDLNKNIDGIAPKLLWDDGISASFLNYKANVSNINSRNTSDEQTHAHLDLAPGFNFGAWRFRNKNLFTKSSSMNSKWQTVHTYVERGINEFESRLTIGDFITTNNLFNNLNLRGVGLRTDETMIPGRFRINTPVIRGVAKTQAYVEVEHNGYVIYTKNVDSGIFELDDLPNVGSSGTYKVTVFESDGTKNIMFVPFAQAPLSLRKGASDYAISIGRYRGSSSGVTGAEILDTSYSYGLNDIITLSTGIQFSDVYGAFATGVGLSLGSLGALSLEGIYAKTKEYNKLKVNKKGGAVTLKYQKGFIETGTELYLANHSYNSKNYRTINEVYESNNSRNIDFVSKRNSLSLGLNQSLNQLGGLRLAYNFDRYWDDREQQYFDISYQGLFKGITYSIGYNEYLNDKNKKNNMFTASIRIPFKRENSQPIFTSYRYNNGNSRGETHSLGVSGSEFDNSLSWNINQKYSNRDHYGGSGNVTLRNPYGYFGVGASRDKNSSSYNANIAGSILFSEQGLNFGHEITQSTALLVAEGATDVPINGKVWLKTNSQGKALITGLQPYRENTLYIDPLEVPDDVEILQTDITVIPTHGAIVKGKLKTSEGFKTLVRLTTVNNKNVPFGSVVTVEGNNSTAGIVGDNGEVFLTGLPESGVLKVKWGTGSDSSCSVNFNMLPFNTEQSLVCK